MITSSGATLGFYGETWADISDHPASGWFVERGIEPEFRLTHNLLRDVLHAAGGVEYVVEKIDAALQVAQDWVDENVTVPGPDEWPEFGVSTSTQANPVSPPAVSSQDERQWSRNSRTVAVALLGAGVAWRPAPSRSRLARRPRPLRSRELNEQFGGD